MKLVSDLLDKDHTILDLRRQNMELRSQLLQHAHDAICGQIAALLVTMQTEVGADTKSTYDPRTKTFVLQARPTPLKAPTSRQLKCAQARTAKKETAP